MNRIDASAARRRVRELYEQLGQDLDLFLGRQCLLKGCLYLSKRRCGKPGCACATGDPHQSTVLAYRGRGKQQNLSPSDPELPALQEMTANYQRFRRARVDLVRRFKELLALIGQLEDHGLERGEQQFRNTPTGRKAR